MTEAGPRPAGCRSAAPRATMRYLTAQHRLKWLALREVAWVGGDRAAALSAVKMTGSGLESMLRRAGCQGKQWPPSPFPDWVFALPVGVSGQRGSAAARAVAAGAAALPAPVLRRAPSHHRAGDSGVKLDDSALSARIAADQARLHGPRRAWLEMEQQRYGLPQRGRLPEEMAA